MGKHFTEIERYRLEFYLEQKMTVKEIAMLLGKCDNTIRNEIRRGTVELIDSEFRKYSKYCADTGQRIADSNKALKGRPLKIDHDFKLCAYMENMILEKHYSPSAAIAEIKRQGLSFSTSVCIKTVYNYIHGNVFLNLTGKKLHRYRRKNPGRDKKHALSPSRAGKYIDSRPKHVLNRTEYGHWEMDTVCSGKGMGKACLLVLTERMTRKELVRKMKSRTQKEVLRCLDRIEKEYGSSVFRNTFKSITCDNGVEFLDFQGIERSLSGDLKRTEVFYCHAYHSWERGSNENLNRMIRRFIPKGASICKFTEEYIRSVQDWLNSYPRKILGWLTPNEAEQASLSSHL